MMSLDTSHAKQESAYLELLERHHALSTEHYQFETLVSYAECLTNVAYSLQHVNEGVSLEGYRLSLTELVGDDDLSMEGLKENLQKAWVAIQKKLKELMDNLMAYLKRLFRNTAKLRNDIDELEDRILEADRRNATMKQQTFKFSRMEMFAPDNNPNARMLLTGLTDTNRAIEDVRRAYLKSALSIFESLNRSAVQVERSIQADAQGTDDAFEAITSLDRQILDLFVKPFERLKSLQRTKLPGGKRIDIREKAFSASTVYEIRITDGTFEYRGDRTVQVATINEMKSFVKEIRQGIRQLENVRPDTDKLTSQFTDLSTKQNRFVERLPEEPESELTEKAAKSWSNLVYWVLRSGTVGNISRMSLYQYRVIQLSLEFVKESLSYYE